MSQATTPIPTPGAAPTAQPSAQPVNIGSQDKATGTDELNLQITEFGGSTEEKRVASRGGSSRYAAFIEACQKLCDNGKVGTGFGIAKPEGLKDKDGKLVDVAKFSQYLSSAMKAATTSGTLVIPAGHNIYKKTLADGRIWFSYETMRERKARAAKDENKTASASA